MQAKHYKLTAAKIMGNIQISIDADANASIFDVRGEVTADDIIAAMDQQYIAGSPRHAVWDYSHAIFHKLEPQDYSRIAAAAKQRATHRAGGKTAFIAPGEQEVVAIKLLEAISKTIDLPIPLRICPTRSDAITWLAEHHGTDSTGKPAETAG